MDEILKEEPKTEEQLKENKIDRENKKEQLEELKKKAEELKLEQIRVEEELRILKEVIESVQNGNFISRLIKEIKLFKSIKSESGEKIIGYGAFPMINALVLFPMIAASLGILISTGLSTFGFGITSSFIVSSLFSVLATKKIFNEDNKKFVALLGNYHMNLQVQMVALNEQGLELEKTIETLTNDMEELEKNKEKIIDDFIKSMSKKCYIDEKTGTSISSVLVKNYPRL